MKKIIVVIGLAVMVGCKGPNSQKAGTTSGNGQPPQSIITTN